MNSKESQNTVQQVKARIRELRETKEAQLAEMAKRQAEAEAQITAAEAAAAKATEDLDIDGYESAKREISKAQTALELYRGRHDQINSKQYVTEAESDHVIDSLLQYEQQLDDEFRKAIAGPVAKLEEIQKDYLDRTHDAEQTIQAWTSEIHANYRSRGTSSYTDEITGERTDRSPKPIPVRPMAHNGCQESSEIRDFLDKLNRTRLYHG